MDDDASKTNDDPEATGGRTDASGDPSAEDGAGPTEDPSAESPEGPTGDDPEPTGDRRQAGDGEPATGPEPADDPADDGVEADSTDGVQADSDDGAPDADVADDAQATGSRADRIEGPDAEEPTGEPSTDDPDADDDGLDAPTEERRETDHDAPTGPGDPAVGDDDPDGTDADLEADRQTDEDSDTDDGGPDADQPVPKVPEDVRKYDRFQKMDGAQYDRVNEFLRERTYVTAREWAMARLCADFRTETGVEMTKIGENLPELVPFMTDEYSPQAVNQARASFEEKVRKAGATFLYGAMSDFFTADELDDLMYEVTEVAKFLLEVEGVDLSVEEELEAEERISSVMREVRQSSDALRHDGMECPNCGHEIETGE